MEEQTPSPIPAPVPSETQKKILSTTLGSENTDAETSQATNGILITLIALFVILVGVVGYVLLFRQQGVKNQAITQTVPSSLTKAVPTVSTASSVKTQPTPIISPVTPVNADQTLSNTDTAMQQSVNQANADLNSISAIDTTQDTTNGL